MRETLHTVVEQLAGEQEHLQRQLQEKELEAQGIKAELQRVEDALAALTAKSRTGPPGKASATRSELLAMVHDALRSTGGTLAAEQLKEAVRKRLKRAGQSARGLHRTLPHVLAHASLKTEGEIVTLRP